MSPFLALPLVTSLLAATSLCFAQAVAPAVPTQPLQPSAPAAADTARIGTFKQIEGDTRMGRAGEQRTPTPGEGVNVNQRLSTGKNGAATIILKDGTVLTMGPDTTMDLSRFQFDSTTQQGNFVLDLLRLQDEVPGTGRAVEAALGALEDFTGDVLVLSASAGSQQNVERLQQAVERIARGLKSWKPDAL